MTETRTYSGAVTFASRQAKERAVFQPETGKRVIATFAEPVKVRKGEVITVRGTFECEGCESIVLRNARLII